MIQFLTIVLLTIASSFYIFDYCMLFLLLFLLFFYLVYESWLNAAIGQFRCIFVLFANIKWTGYKIITKKSAWHDVITITRINKNSTLTKTWDSSSNRNTEWNDHISECKLRHSKRFISHPLHNHRNFQFPRKTDGERT